MIRDWLLGALAGFIRPPAPIAQDAAPSLAPYKIRSLEDLDRLPTADRTELIRRTFAPAPKPWFVPQDAPALPHMAMDDGSLFSAMQGFLDAGPFASGVAWLGYPYLSELTQIAEFRLISETIAEETTRKWIVFEASGKNDKEAKIVELTKLCTEKYRLQDVFRRAEEMDGEFGIGHVYADLKLAGSRPVWDDAETLNSPLVIDRRTIKKNSLDGFTCVEPLWTYPAAYNANNPLRKDFYRPSSWYVMSSTVHRSRLLTFQGREMPDLLKPAYSFGGMSLTQMTQPAVNYYLQNRADVARLVGNFSTMVLKTDMTAALQGGSTDFMTKRAAMYNSFRGNSGLMFVNKGSGADEGESLDNVAVPLSSLPELQQQAAEHMAFTAQEPLVKLLGITPAGLNSSTDGEIRTFYDRMHAFQEKRFGAHLRTCIHLIMLSEWGYIDEDITWRFLPLWQLDEAGLAAVQKTKSDIREQDISSGQISPEEGRRSTASDPESIYQGLDLESGEAPGTSEQDGEGEPIDDPDTNKIDRESESAGGGGGSGAASGV